MDKEKLDFKVKAEAHLLMLDMLSKLAPDEDKPIFAFPKVCFAIMDKMNTILGMMPETSMDEKREYAANALEFVNRVSDAIDAFIEQNKAEE